ncbi:MAG: DUF1702 family protein [Gaiellaceae bacterium]
MRLADAAQLVAGRIRTLVFRIDESRVTFESRGIEVSDPEASRRLESGAVYFARGFKGAMADTRADRIAARFDEMDPDFRGFAFEGSGMALSVLDALVPPRRRLAELLDRYGDRWDSLIYIGVGWTWARVGKIPRRPPDRFDRVLGWLTFDGAGFHEGFLKRDDYVNGQRRPAGLSGPALRIFDQGVGRSILFVRGDDLEAVRDTIEAFPAERRPDLWSGVGVAATYAGGLGEERVARLRELTHPHESRLAQGAAFAVMARVRARNETRDTAIGARVLCGAPAPEVAERAEAALREVPQDADSPLEAWQACLRQTFAAKTAAA